MVERYHLVLAGLALVVGVAALVAEWWGPTSIRRHVLGAAALVGALLGGWGNPRSWPWWLAALAIALLSDRPTPTHPLGRWTAPLAVVSLVGVWAAVPDTEPPLAVGAALAPLAALRLWRGPAVGPAGTGVLVVAVLGSTWVGSAGWGAALATAAAVGLVAVAPLVMGFGATLRGQHLVLLAGAHTVVALAVPRVIMDQTVPVAVAIALAELGLLGLLAALVARQEPLESGEI